MPCFQPGEGEFYRFGSSVLRSRFLAVCNVKGAKKCNKLFILIKLFCNFAVYRISQPGRGGEVDNFLFI